MSRRDIEPVTVRTTYVDTSDYEHDGVGLLAGWPQRVPLGHGVDVDAKYLAWVARRFERVFWRWSIEELLQEVYLVATKLAAGYDPSKSKFETYLRAFAYGKLLHSYHKQFRMAGTGNQAPKGAGWVCFPDEDGWIHSVYANESAHRDEAYGEVLDVLMEDLPPNQREATCCWLLGIPQPVIAKVKGISSSAVSDRFQKAKKRMRQIADEIGVTDERLW